MYKVHSSLDQRRHHSEYENVSTVAKAQLRNGRKYSNIFPHSEEPSDRQRAENRRKIMYFHQGKRIYLQVYGVLATSNKKH